MTLLATIELDTTIQCRADIDIATVNDYAEHMGDGVVFPAVVLFGDEHKSYIGDGWHRVMAARTLGLAEIEADLRPGGRLDALKFALSANTVHGRRRTTPDKQCAIAIALREFGKLSDVELARMCAVTDKTVAAMRRRLNPTSEIPMFDTRLGRDGKERRAPQSSTIGSTLEPITPAPAPADPPLPKPGPPRNGMHFARLAVLNLEQIRGDDLERDQAIAFVKGWIREQE